MAVIFYDTFNNRGPQATLGNASETGQAYISVGTCVAGVTGGQAYGVSGDHENGWQGFNPGVSNVKVSMIFAKSDIIADYSTRLVFRGQDVNNFWHVQVHADGYGLERKVGGSWTVVHTDHSGKANGDLIEVECNGTSIIVRKNGTAIPGMSVTSTVLQTATSFGFSFFQGTGTTGNKIDEFKIEDFSSSGATATKNLSESATVSEAASKSIGKIPAETITMADSISMVFTPGSATASETIPEILTVTDTIQKLVTRQNSETITTADAQATKSVSKTRSETFALAEKFSKSIAKTRTESISLSEIISKVAGKVKSETVAVSEGTVSKQISVLKIDTVPVAETPNKAYGRTLADAVSISDPNVSKLTGKAVSVVDTITIVDSISKSIFKTKSDSIAPSETDSEAINRELTDIISGLDSIALLSGKAISLSDTVLLTDVISKSVTKLRTDSTTASESASDVSNLHATLFDVVVTTDTMTAINPNAPVLDLIGIINLEGEQTLYVYLAGSQDLIVNLEGGLGPMAKEGQNFEMYAGESKFLDIPLKAQNGSALNLTNATVKFELKKMPGYPEIEVTKTSPDGIALNTPIVGSIRITLGKNDTADLSGVYNYFVSIVDSNNYDSVTTVGDITIKER